MDATRRDRLMKAEGLDTAAQIDALICSALITLVLPLSPSLFLSISFFLFLSTIGQTANPTEPNKT